MLVGLEPNPSWQESTGLTLLDLDLILIAYLVWLHSTRTGRFFELPAWLLAMGSSLMLSAQWLHFLKVGSRF